MTGIAVSMKQMQAIEQSGYGMNGMIGGLPRKTYYTPDGRTIRAIPATRTYVIKNAAGQVIESGERDANYDKGWLPIMPDAKKPYCPSCDRWHDTAAQVRKCKAEKAKMLEAAEAKARKELGEQQGEPPSDRLVALEQKVDKLTELFERMLNGAILQRDANEPKGSGSGKTGTAKAGV